MLLLCYFCMFVRVVVLLALLLLLSLIHILCVVAFLVVVCIDYLLCVVIVFVESVCGSLCVLAHPYAAVFDRVYIAIHRPLINFFHVFILHRFII